MKLIKIIVIIVAVITVTTGAVAYRTLHFDYGNDRFMKNMGGS